MALDACDYLSDILFLRTDKFSFKTAYFVKRHWHSFSHTFAHIWEECVKIWEGQKAFNKDIKLAYRHFKKQY